jgi:phosphohistidine swiveling domain-containing protein
MRKLIHSSDNWKHYLTRDLPLVRFYMMLEGYIEKSKKVWGWQYRTGCAYSKKGILKIYRRENEFNLSAKKFIALKNKNERLERIRISTRVERKKIEALMRAIRKKLKTPRTADELVEMIKQAHEGFIAYWAGQAFALELGGSFGNLGKPELLEKYSLILHKMRIENQTTMMKLETLIDDLIRSIADTKNMSPDLLFNALPAEIINDKLDLKELRRRRGGYLLIGSENELKLYSEKKLINPIIKYLEKESAKKISDKDIKGQTVFPGKITGRVIVVMHKKKLTEIKNNDILVTPMTEFDYIPYLDTVSAIITDEGGITCHAAIIARELKKPCIIGTKIATKVLKDGDFVEVDSANGVVRIIKP